MKKANHYPAWLITAIIVFVQVNATAQTQYHYPLTRKVNQVDTLFGVAIEDPYRWMENDTTTEVKDWVTAQNKITYTYLEKISFRETLRKRLTELNDNPFYSAPRHIGDYYFFYANTGLQAQDVIYRKKGLNGKPDIFLDANTFSSDSTTRVSLDNYSEDKKLVIATINVAGSDITNPIVYNVATAKPLPDYLDGIKNSSYAWKGNGFYYSRYELVPKGKELTALNENQTIFYHAIGTSQSDDKLVFATKDKPLSFNDPDITEDKRFLLIYSFSGNNNTDIYYRDFSSPDTTLHLLVPGRDNINEEIIDDSSGMLIMRTNRNAPNGKVVLIDPKHPESANWKILIAEKEKPLRRISKAYGKLFITYLRMSLHGYISTVIPGSLKRKLNCPTWAMLLR